MGAGRRAGRRGGRVAQSTTSVTASHARLHAAGAAQERAYLPARSRRCSRMLRSFSASRNRAGGVSSAGGRQPSRYSSLCEHSALNLESRADWLELSARVRPAAREHETGLAARGQRHGVWQLGDDRVARRVGRWAGPGSARGCRWTRISAGRGPGTSLYSMPALLNTTSPGQSPARGFFGRAARLGALNIGRGQVGRVGGPRH